MHTNQHSDARGTKHHLMLMTLAEEGLNESVGPADKCPMSQSVLDSMAAHCFIVV